MTPAVDVVILTWNDGAVLERAVASALASKEVEVRVIIVDNGSNTRPFLPCDRRVTLIRNDSNMGVSRGRNQGAKAATAPYVCFLDSDASLFPETLAVLVKSILESPGVALAAPVFSEQRPEASAGQSPSPVVKLSRVFGFRDTYLPVPHRGPSWDVDFAIGACQLVRREQFLAVGGFDEAYFYGPEDVDLCLRLRKAQLRVIQDGRALCNHPPRRRNRSLLTRRGIKHAMAVVRHLWRHRGFRRCYAP